MGTPIYSYSLVVHLLVLLLAFLAKQLKHLIIKLRHLVKPAKAPSQTKPAVAGVNYLTKKSRAELTPNQQ